MQVFGREAPENGAEGAVFENFRAAGSRTESDLTEPCSILQQLLPIHITTYSMGQGCGWDPPSAHRFKMGIHRFSNNANNRF